MIWYDMYSVKFELPMASFFKYICSFFARNFVVGFMLQCFYVPILLSRLFLRSKSVQKCSTAQSFTFPKFTSFKLGTLHAHPVLSSQFTPVKHKVMTAFALFFFKKCWTQVSEGMNRINFRYNWSHLPMNYELFTDWNSGVANCGTGNSGFGWVYRGPQESGILRNLQKNYLDVCVAISCLR